MSKAVDTKSKMPVLFIGHGSPTNAIEDNQFTAGWKSIAQKIPCPKAILCISAHWLTEGTAVTAMKSPRTIHDFYGFPEELYKIRYPAGGSVEYAALIKQNVKTVAVDFDHEWGLDHGTWSVLRHMYPKADIPVLQLSLDYQISPKKAFAIGQELGQLRKTGLLIIGSGNLVHNLMLMDWNSDVPYDWAIDFDSFVRNGMEKCDYAGFFNYIKHPSAVLAHPTNDHYLPLLYTMGAAENEQPQFFNEKIVYKSISMRCATWGL